MFRPIVGIKPKKPFLESSKCFEENTDYYGYDIDWVSASNPLNCQLKCQFNEKCKFWTYNTASGGNGLNCWLKSNGDYIVPNFERASGPKYCGKCIVEYLMEMLEFNLWHF